MSALQTIAELAALGYAVRFHLNPEGVPVVQLIDDTNEVICEDAALAPTRTHESMTQGFQSALASIHVQALEVHCDDEPEDAQCDVCNAIFPIDAEGASFEPVGNRCPECTRKEEEL